MKVGEGVAKIKLAGDKSGGKRILGCREMVNTANYLIFGYTHKLTPLISIPIHRCLLLTELLTQISGKMYCRFNATICSLQMQIQCLVLQIGVGESVSAD